MPAFAESFTNPVRIVTPIDPDAVISGDLNGDGRRDLIWFKVVNGATTGHVLLAGPNNSFQPGQDFSFPANINVSRAPMCVTADVTRDARLDLICANYDPNTHIGSVFVFPGNGDGTLGAASVNKLSNQISDAVILASVGDLNGDGVSDFLLEQPYNSFVLVLLSDGKGGFLPSKTVVGNVAFSVPVIADINGDGIPDILWRDGLAVSLGKGDGSFGPLITSYTYTSPPGGGTCAFHDMDQDGKLDAVCGYPTSGNGGTTLDILHGNGDGTFNTTPIFHLPFGSTSVSGSGAGTFLYPELVADVNGDGIPDILAYSGDGLAVFLGAPGLSFGPPREYAIAAVGFAFLVDQAAQQQFVDLNGDGLMDLLSCGPNGLYLTYGHADGTFGTAPAPEVGVITGPTAMADFNRDGKQNLVATGSPQLTLNLGNGDGTFAPPISLQSSPVTSSSQIYAADFNGDGKPDLLANDSTYAPYLLFGHGDGTFATPQAATGIAAPLNTSNGSVGVVGDIDGDGKADLLLPSISSLSSTYSLVAALSLGNGTFRSVSTTYTAPVMPNGVSYYTPGTPILADLANRGKLDAAYILSTGLYVVQGHGNGSFDTTPSILPIPAHLGVAANGYSAVQSADFDGDGKPDLALVTEYQLPYSFSYQGVPSCVWIYYGKGDGTFIAPVQAGCFAHSYTSFKAADLNGDGLPDLVLQTASSLNTFAVGIVHSAAGRTFGPEICYTAGALSGDLFIKDLNGDGRPDLIFGNVASDAASSVTILLNQLDSGPVASATTLISSQNPSSPGTTVVFTATVKAGDASVPAGSMTFTDNSVALGTVPLIPGTASATTSVSEAPSTGTHTIVATYVPSGPLQASSASLIQIVSAPSTPSATQLTLQPVRTPAPALFGSYSFRSSLTSSQSSGSASVANQPVTITVQGFPPATLTTDNSGSIVYVTPFTLSAATYTVTAHFAGSTSLTQSDASTLQQIVPDQTSLILSAPATSPQGGAATITSTVTNLDGSASIAAANPSNGTITILDGGIAIATLTPGPTASLSAGVSFTTSQLASGLHTLTAVFTSKSGDITSASAGPVSLLITDPLFDLKVSSPTLSIQAEHHGNITATISSISGFNGLVNLTCSTPAGLLLTCEVGGDKRPSSASMQIASGGSVSLPVILDTDAVLDFKSALIPEPSRHNSATDVVWALLLPACGFGLLRCRLKAGRVNRLTLFVLLIAATLGLGVGLTGCSAKYPQHALVGSYDIVLTATSSSSVGAPVVRHITLQVTP
ncbi:FG-GAP-like repeat-containing protein [Granulicella tundricola]|uniref:FG-GAP-like repeat-containing protein n=1 Tax=Granulicella tundricola TaxID=940615 RepID=UPI0005A24E84|nr:FG-GAP-like repeat-containing protein [Granulicella tundricola]